MKIHSHTLLMLFTCFQMMLGIRCSAWARGNFPIVPTNGKSITLLINGEEKTYYVLTKNNPLTIEVDGPGKLTLLNRLGLLNTSAASVQYSIKVMEGKNTLKIH